jgi:hypothetical protein
MAITGIVPQLRTTDMASSIRFYTENQPTTSYPSKQIPNHELGR